MEGTPFEARVRSLREKWVERRETGTLSRSHDLESQLRVFENVHRWASECLGDIDIVYGEALNTAIDPLAGSGASRRFAVAVGGDERATFELVDRGTAERPAWLGVVRVAAGGRPREGERRIRFWRRPQVEEIVRSLLGAYERARSRERAG